MVIGPEKRPDILRAIADHLLAHLHQERFEVVSKEEITTSIDLLEGYRILREDDRSNLGWRIVLTVDPIDELARVIRTTVDSGEPLKRLLPVEYVERHLAAAGEESDERVDEEASIEEDVDKEAEQEPRIKVLVTNFLGSKGLDADHVILVGMNDRTFPEVPTAIKEDEVCRFIVGLTRAKRSCAVVTHKEFDYVQRIMVGRPSTFLRWLPAERTNERHYRLGGGRLSEIT